MIFLNNRSSWQPVDASKQVLPSIFDASNDVKLVVIQQQFWKKKALRETQTPRAGCSKAEPKIFAPPQTPFPGAQDGQNLISWRWSLPLPTDPVWWGSMNAISSYRGNRPTHKETHRLDRLQCAAPLLRSTQCRPNNETTTFNKCGDRKLLSISFWVNYISTASDTSVKRKSRHCNILVVFCKQPPI